MADGIRLTLEGKEEVLSELGAMAEKASYPRDLFSAVGLAMVESTSYRFEQEQGPDGSPWPASLRALLTGGKTLTDTAFLSGSLTYEANDGGVAIGTNVIYAAIHQLGGVIKAKTPKGLHFQSRGTGDWVRTESVTIPARPFLGVDEEDAKEIEFIVSEWLNVEYEWDESYVFDYERDR